MNTNKIYFILVGAIAAAVLLSIVIVLRGLGGNVQQKATLEFWGVFDSRDAFEKTIRNFQAQNQGININYRLIPYEEYELALIDALATGQGPDLVMLHNTWLAKHKGKLSVLPEKISSQKEPLMTVKDFQNQFVDVAFSDLVSENKIYGLPLFVDTLALYYNKDLFNTAGITRPPETWVEVNDAVQKITRFDLDQNIVQSGVALGTARNINRSTDILMAMMIQSGVRMNDEGGGLATFSSPVGGQRVGEITLQYYTDFANPSKQTYTWNDSQHYSIDAFTEGKTAMMINYSHQEPLIRARAPRLNFAVSKMPQASITDIKNFANYWAVGVSNQSKNQEAAWKFAAYLTSREGITEYINNTQRPTARRDLIDLQKEDPSLGLFAVQALTAKSWQQSDSRAVEGIFADMIDDVNFRRTNIREAIERAESRVNTLLRR